MSNSSGAWPAPEHLKLSPEEHSLWDRVHRACPQITPLDADVVSMLIRHSMATRRMVDEVSAARAQGARFDFDPDKMIADQMGLVDQLLESCLISRPLARRLGLLPLGIAGGDAEEPGVPES